MDATSPPPTRRVNEWAAGKRRRLTRAQKLAGAAKAAADVRAYDTDPDVVALRIERLRTRVDRLIWTGLILGLAFTMANVQAFAADGEKQFTVMWWIAWLLDPMVSLVLVGVLLGEQIIARHGIRGGRWIRRTKWTALILTYAMNTWSSWATVFDGTPQFGKILLHSVPPVMVFCAAEAVTTLKHQITEAVHKAYHWAAVRAAAIRDAEAGAVERAQAIADAHAATELKTEPETANAQQAVAALSAWMRGRRAVAPTELVSEEDAPVFVETPAERRPERPSPVGPAVPLAVVESDSPAVSDDDEFGDYDGDRRRDDDADRERPDEQDNRDAETWIRRQCRGQNGVGRKPAKTDVAERYGFSGTWARNRVQAVQERMTAQGYRFESDGTVYAPTRSVSTRDASTRSEVSA